MFVSQPFKQIYLKKHTCPSVDNIPFIFGIALSMEMFAINLQWGKAEHSCQALLKVLYVLSETFTCVS